MRLLEKHSYTIHYRNGHPSYEVPGISYRLEGGDGNPQTAYFKQDGEGAADIAVPLPFGSVRVIINNWDWEQRYFHYTPGSPIGQSLPVKAPSGPSSIEVTFDQIFYRLSCACETYASGDLCDHVLMFFEFNAEVVDAADAEQFDGLRRAVENKPLVKAYLKMRDEKAFTGTKLVQMMTAGIRTDFR